MKNNEILEKIEDIKLKYAFGDCAVFATVLSDFYNLPIVEFYAGKELYHVAVVVEGKSLKDDLFIDVLGVNSYKEIKSRYAMKGKQSIEAKTKDELRKMSLFDTNDIKIAKESFHLMLEQELLPNFDTTSSLAKKSKIALKNK